MKMRNKMFRIASVPVCFCMLTLSCMLGGTAEQGNARITGSLNSELSDDAVVAVHLVEEGFNPLNEGSAVVCSTKTDSSGGYLFENVPFGVYYLYAFDGKNRFVLLDGPYTVDGENVAMDEKMLHASSVITVNDSSIKDVAPLYYIKGMSTINTVSSTLLEPIQITGVPAGVHDVMKQNLTTEDLEVFTRNLEIIPGDSITISENNRPPRLDSSSFQVPETLFVDSRYSFRVSAADPDGDTVTYRLVNAPQSCTIDTADGTLSWTPNVANAGNTGITVKVSDPDGASSITKWNAVVKTPAPLLLEVADTFFCYDTIIEEQSERSTDTIYLPVVIEAFSLTTIFTTFYRFYCNGRAITGWIGQSETSYLPNATGTYVFSVEAWCDTLAGIVSEKSDPYTVTILHDLPTPVITGDTLYDQSALDTLRFQITSPTRIGGESVAYRIRLYNETLESTYDSTIQIGNLVISGMCSDTMCSGTAGLNFNTYTPWLYGKTLSVMLQRPQGVYRLYVQGWIEGQKMSEETVVSIHPR